ncbi:hypothetical protein NDU88_013032 [Pleurodeles waltl]|uniref:Uncharacterized protein n=1 Tax=Pleurodeles waltl TaxID=8319 RepID=A0AAV7R1Y4_PLEWA|nr:hypothetical protein NDU88_013032 [Pleurodeles waltl]
MGPIPPLRVSGQLATVFPRRSEENHRTATAVLQQGSQSHLCRCDRTAPSRARSNVGDSRLLSQGACVVNGGCGPSPFLFISDDYPAPGERGTIGLTRQIRELSPNTV